MGRIIQTEGAGKERNLLTRDIAVALNEFGHLSNFDHEARDIAAYIAIRLESIERTIDKSVAAWEKRGYWVKSDRFRYEWRWVEIFAKELKGAIATEDWENVIQIVGQVGTRLSHIKLPKRALSTKPWLGDWERLITGKKSP